MNTHQQRSNRGNMLVLIICITTAVIIPIFVLVSKMGPYMSSRGRAQNVVEAAGLLVANDISRLVENDPHFGFVSISNFPATGKATKAKDGESLPVLSINTVIGTVRQNAIIADELRNETMSKLVDEDLVALDKTTKGLNIIVTESLKENPNLTLCMDLDGNYIKPVEDVRKFLKDNLPYNVRVESLKMTLGWLDESETTIDVPKPQTKARVQTVDIDNGKYQAFKNLPVGKRSFSFGGIGTQSHLVSTRNFRPDDGHHMCTIVKMDCTLVNEAEPDKPIQCVVCSQPFSHPDDGAKGSMTVRFAQKPVPGLNSWSDFLASGSFTDHGIMNFDIVGGDFPYDPKAQMRLSSQKEQSPGTSQEFAEHLYNWLSNGRSTPTIDAILSMMSDPFRAEDNQVYTYSFESDGTISRKVNGGQDFTRAVTADGQVATLADTQIKNGSNAVIFFRDNVGNKAGKHGGQPLAGYPITNSNTTTNHTELAKEFSKRNKHHDGLAVDIEIGGTGDSSRDSKLTMHQRTPTPRHI